MPSGGAGTRKRSEDLNGSGGTSVRSPLTKAAPVPCMWIGSLNLQPQFDESYIAVHLSKVLNIR